MFDTGARDAVTPETAATLGLNTEGSGTARDSGGDKLYIALTRVAVMHLGDAEMTDQPLQCFPCRDISQIAATDPRSTTSCSRALRSASIATAGRCRWCLSSDTLLSLKAVPKSPCRRHSPAAVDLPRYGRARLPCAAALTGRAACYPGCTNRSKPGTSRPGSSW